MRIVFMGTPDFAAVSLKKLIERGREIAGVFTQPDRPRGRGMALQASPVKALALANGIPVFQPEKMRDGSAAGTLRALAPDLVIAVAYGRILPPEMLAVPPLGCINVHASLLPRYRGSAPIQWAVLNGDRRTGVTTMYLAPELDAGDLIYSEETEIGEFETSGELFDRLAVLGGDLLVRTVDAIESGAAPRTPQDPSRATFTAQLDKSLCPIVWSRTPREIVKQICGLQPWPVATAQFGGETFRIFAAQYTEHTTNKAPGSIVAAGKAGLEIACGAGKTLLITELQAPGKRRMRASDYLLGHPMRAE